MWYLVTDVLTDDIIGFLIANKIIYTICLSDFVKSGTIFPVIFLSGVAVIHSLLSFGKTLNEKSE